MFCFQKKGYDHDQKAKPDAVQNAKDDLPDQDSGRSDAYQLAKRHRSYDERQRLCASDPALTGPRLAGTPRGLQPARAWTRTATLWRLPGRWSRG